MLKATGWFDGSCGPTNPGNMGIGAILKVGEDVIGTVSAAAGQGTNNEAEWLALIGLLEKARELEVDELEVRGDSQLVIKQVMGKWKVKAGHLLKYKRRARGIMVSFARVSFKWVRRDENAEADRLAMQWTSAERLDRMDDLRSVRAIAGRL